MWVVEGRDGARFPIETIAELRVTSERLGENLDRDDAIEPRIPRFVDLTHPARADGDEDFVGTEASARRHFLKPAVPFSTTVMVVGACSAAGVAMRNRWPSRLGT